MSTRPPNSSPGQLDQLAMRYLRQALDTPHPTDEPYVLNAMESRVIRRTKTLTLFVAAVLGTVGVLLLYFPQYFWPNLFQNTTIPFLGGSYEIPLVTLLYSLLLVYIEVNLLMALNLFGVRTIMQVCQFPRDHDAQYEHHLRSLADAAIKKTNNSFLRFGIDPYLNLPRWGLTIFFMLNMARAALSNLVLKLAIRPLLGRYALRQVTDMAGAPVYAVWNAYASWQVLREAQVRVMAPLTIREFVNELYDECGTDDEFRHLILEALQYVAILRRQYNYAHFLLTEALVGRFNLDLNATLTGHFVEQVVHAPLNVRRSLERLIVFGVLVDGRLSWIEKQRLRQLRHRGFLTYSTQEIRRIGEEYNQGKGLWV